MSTDGLPGAQHFEDAKGILARESSGRRTSPTYDAVTYSRLLAYAMVLGLAVGPTDSFDADDVVRRLTALAE